MPPNFDYIAHPDYLEVVVCGPYDPELAVSEFSKMLTVCQDSQQPRALVDYRQLSDLDSNVEKILYTFKVEEIYNTYLGKSGRPIRLGYLTNSTSNEPGADIGRQINGLAFELFDDKELAVQWLLAEH